MNNASFIIEREFALAQKARLLQARPQLPFQERDDAPSALPVLVLDAPAKPHQLRVCFDDGEVTIGFAEWHHHALDFDDALDVIDRIVSGRDGVAIAEDLATGAWQGSALLAPPVGARGEGAALPIRHLAFERGPVV
jgi:hypothetical protein